MTDPSFYYAIFKKLQASCGTDLVYANGHLNGDMSDDLAGGCSLRHTQDQFGIFQHLQTGMTGAMAYSADGIGHLDSTMQPLTPMNNDPLQNPLFVMLKASLTPGGVPGNAAGYHFVTVGSKNWPVMPPPDLNGLPTNHPEWVGFNTGSHTLIDALATWITNGKTDDSPQDAPLTYAALSATVLKPFGFAKASDGFPILFVASMAGDDGRRPGDKGVPAAAPDHVPAHFWATSQIFLTYPPGVAGHAAGTIAYPAQLQPGDEYYVAAIIGNAGNVPTGRVMPLVKNYILVVCEAQAFNSGLGPVTPLPALNNLDVQSTSPVYEQYGLGPAHYDVVGFRFNVDAVIAGLKKALSDAGTNLGGLSADEWLNDGHPCVKVLITGGEPQGPYAPDPNAPPTFESNPRTERHAAQRNLAPFFIPPVMADKKIGWKNFIVGQIGSGANQLELQHTLPAEAFHFYLAIPTKSYERFVAKGGVRGFEVVSKVANKPFPDAVILRQTGAAATLRVSEHAHERFLGMSLGIECDPARLKGRRLSDVSMVQATHDGTIAGGFTLQLQMGK